MHESQTVTKAVSDGIAGNTIENDTHDGHITPNSDSDGFLREAIVVTPIVLDNEERGKGKRIQYPSIKLRGFVTHTIRKVSPSPSPPSSPSTQTSSMSYPIAHFVNCDRFSTGHRNFLAAVSTRFEP